MHNSGYTVPVSTDTDGALAVHHHYRRHAAWIALALICGVGICYGAYRLFLFRTSVGFSYANATCVRDFTPLPRLFKPQPSASLRAEPSGLRTLAGYPLLATSTCLQAFSPPPAGSVESPRLSLGGVGLLAKEYTVDLPQRPKIPSQALLKLPLPVHGNLRLELDVADIVYDYSVSADGRSSNCRQKGRELLCDIAALKLGQATEYDLKVKQLFDGKPVADVVAKRVRTTAPVTVVQSSVTAGSTVFDKPDKLIIKTDKQLRTAEVTLEAIGKATGRTAVAVRSEISGEQVIVHFNQPLPRETDFELTLRSALGTENGYLEKPHILAFTTSGGPKPKSVNIGSKAVALQPSIAVSFDQPLKPDTIPSSLVSLKTGDKTIAVSATLAGSVLTVRPQQALSLCAKLTLHIAGNPVNLHDVSSAVDWTFRSRAVCHTVGSIGTSVQGRPIQAYRFGSGPSKVLYIGATHGDERGTRQLMDTWIESLEAEPDRIPSHRSIIVVPNLNPDGYAAGSRRNANGVDLNRNFPAGNWKPDVTMPGGSMAIGGGGSVALSEPESRAIAELVSTEKPRLVLTYHSIGSLVQPNGSGDSLALAQAYAATSRYYVLSAGGASPFVYDTTGALEDWMHDILGLPAVVVELGSHENSEWSRNAAAMWKMVQMP